MISLGTYLLRYVDASHELVIEFRIELVLEQVDV